ncbi:hypothetical protein NDU88_004869 [Pleurodeles waltl]|uniref:Uncharacterized protein n=1 Tax=Pleurodeles waltl TaxID=8319 RepID=A0AAV7VL59_PLEWA|nr:hypothetical protein NDU88_004869 [Pleurodeles waltl]
MEVKDNSPEAEESEDDGRNSCWIADDSCGGSHRKNEDAGRIFTTPGPENQEGGEPNTPATLLGERGPRRSAYPIGSELYPRDPGDVKGEITEFTGGAEGWRGDFQKASEDRTRRLERIQVKRSRLRSSGIPEDRARPEQRIITVPTRDEDRRPWEANA